MDTQKTHLLSRRYFLKNSLAGAAGFAFLPGFLSARVAPSDTIRLGVIGLGRQATGLTQNFMAIPGVQVVAGSDVYGIKRQRFAGMVNRFYQGAKQKVDVKTYEHYRDLLSRKDIDAVVIVTPDHWHALMAIEACKAGKDIYLEKPLTYTIREGQELVKAVRAHNRVLAVGSQQRSAPGFQHAVKLVQEGRIGQLERINAFTGAQPPKPYDLPAEPVPQDLNWELWLGPAPYVHYNSKLNPPISLNPPQDEQLWGAWRSYKELGGGLTTDWGAHMFDIGQWALGKDNSGPVKVIPPGYQDYDHLTYVYDKGVVMTDRPWDDKKSRGVKFWGTNGWIEVTREFFRSSDPAHALQDARETRGAHQLNFIESIRLRKDPIARVETGHRTCTVCTLGNIAMDLKRPVQWNPGTETFVSDAQASTYLHRPYRDGYSLG